MPKWPRAAAKQPLLGQRPQPSPPISPLLLSIPPAARTRTGPTLSARARRSRAVLQCACLLTGGWTAPLLPRHESASGERPVIARVPVLSLAVHAFPELQRVRRAGRPQLPRKVAVLRRHVP